MNKLSRRGWWVVLLGVITGRAGHAAATSTCPDDVNRFACLYRAWVDLVWKNNGNPNMLDAVEVATWQSVRHAWRELEKQMNRMYGI